MKPDYADGDFLVGPPLADKPKEGTGWTAQWSEAGSLPVLTPGGTVTALVCVERDTSIRTSAKLVGKTSSKDVTLAFAPSTIVVDARRGSRALVECRLTTALSLAKDTSVGVTIWAEDA